MSTYGWGNAGTVAKTPQAEAGLVWDPRLRRWVPRKKPGPAAPAPPPTNPYAAPYDEAMAGVLKGPDYSGVPQYSDEELDAKASAWADKYLKEAVAPYESMKGDVKKVYDFSGQMANNFGQAVALVFSGAAPGQTTVSEGDAQAYAEKEFGSKYAIGAVMQQLGSELMTRITSGFTDRMFEISAKIADIYSRRPDLMEQHKQLLVDQVQDMKDAADATWEQRVQIAGLLQASRDDWDKQNEPTQDEIVMINGLPYTFKNGRLNAVPGGPKAAGAAASTMSGVDVSRVQNAFDLAQDKFEAYIAAGKNRKTAMAKVKKDLLATADSIEAAYPAMADAIRKRVKGWEPVPVAPDEKDAPQTKIYSMDGVGIVKVTEDGQTEVLFPEPKESKTPPSPKSIGGFIWYPDPKAPGGWRKGERTATESSAGAGKDSKVTLSSYKEDVSDFLRKMKEELLYDELGVARLSDAELRKKGVRAIAFNRLWSQFGFDLKAMGFKVPAIQRMINEVLTAQGYPRK